jgi:hypothetical protein
MNSGRCRADWQPVFSDIWGLVAPTTLPWRRTNEESIQRLARRQWDLWGRFVAALQVGLSASDPIRLVEAGLQVIPANSEYARVVKSVMDFHARQPEDWHAAYQFLFENFGYDRYPGVVHIIPNAGILVMALSTARAPPGRSGLPPMEVGI